MKNSQGDPRRGSKIHREQPRFTSPPILRSMARTGTTRRGTPTPLSGPLIGMEELVTRDSSLGTESAQGRSLELGVIRQGQRGPGPIGVGADHRDVLPLPNDTEAQSL